MSVFYSLIVSQGKKPYALTPLFSTFPAERVAIARYLSLFIDYVFVFKHIITKEFSTAVLCTIYVGFVNN